jgi:hypothetical protein
MCACRQERGSSKRSAALCPHYLVNNRKIVTAGPTPISTLSMLTSCGVMAMKSPTLAVLVAGAAIDLMPVSASALCVPPEVALCMASRPPTILSGAKYHEALPRHLSGATVGMASVLRRQRITALCRDGTDDCWR